jgi:hypothetical protein
VKEVHQEKSGHALLPAAGSVRSAWPAGHHLVGGGVERLARHANSASGHGYEDTLAFAEAFTG